MVLGEPKCLFPGVDSVSWHFEGVTVHGPRWRSGCPLDQVPEGKRSSSRSERVWLRTWAGATSWQCLWSLPSSSPHIGHLADLASCCDELVYLDSPTRLYLPHKLTTFVQTTNPHLHIVCVHRSGGYCADAGALDLEEAGGSGPACLAPGFGHHR